MEMTATTEFDHKRCKTISLVDVCVGTLHVDESPWFRYFNDFETSLRLSWMYFQGGM